MKKPKTIVVIPAYNAAKTIEKTCLKIPKKLVDEIIVVNDGSSDSTLAIIKKLNVRHKTHSANRGYGASQKTGYKYALDLGADIIIMLHADGQHDPRYIKNLISCISNRSFDMVLGSRIKNVSDAFSSGMPIYKIIFNKLLTVLENIILGLNLTEYHTGYRAYKRKVLETLNLDKFSDDFIFDQQIIFSARLHNFKIGEITTSCIYHKNASSINLSRSLKYGLGVLGTILLFFVDKKRFQ